MIPRPLAVLHEELTTLRQDLQELRDAAQQGVIEPDAVWERACARLAEQIRVLAVEMAQTLAPDRERA